MIGHVTLTSIDPDRTGVAFQTGRRRHHSREWNYQGIVMTDDLVMGAIYQT